MFTLHLLFLKIEMPVDQLSWTASLTRDIPIAQSYLKIIVFSGYEVSTHSVCMSITVIRGSK